MARTWKEQGFVVDSDEDDTDHLEVWQLNAAAVEQARDPYESPQSSAIAGERDGDGSQHQDPAWGGPDDMQPAAAMQRTTAPGSDELCTLQSTKTLIAPVQAPFTRGPKTAKGDRSDSSHGISVEEHGNKWALEASSARQISGGSVEVVVQPLAAIPVFESPYDSRQVDEHASLSTSPSNGGSVQVRKSLRKRNPIQLHPYMLESERYRQTLKGSGLKPVRLDEGQLRECDAQEEDYVQVRSLSPLSVPGVERQFASPARSGDRLQQVGGSSESRSAATQTGQARQARPTYVAAGAKRRRTSPEGLRSECVGVGKFDAAVSRAKPNGKPVFRMPNLHTLSRPPVTGIQPLPSPSLPSLPTSPCALVPAILMDVDSSPSQAAAGASSYPTPNTSSAQQAVFERREPSSPTGGSPTLEPDRPTTGSGSESDTERLDLMKSYGRRVRGVLPASWLRLDKQQIKEPRKTTKSQIKATSARTIDSLAGVARKISRPRVRPVLHPAVELDDSLSDTSDRGSLAAASVERDAAPTQSSIRQFAVKTRSPRRHRGHPQLDPMRPVKAQMESRPGRLNFDRTSAVPLGISDGFEARATLHGHAPAFIAVARRTTRQRDDMGRRLPSRKTFRMHDSFSGRDVERSFRRWHNRSFEQVARPEPTGARPQSWQPKLSRVDQTTQPTPKWNARTPFSPISASIENRKSVTNTPQGGDQSGRDFKDSSLTNASPVANSSMRAEALASTRHRPHQHAVAAPSRPRTTQVERTTVAQRPRAKKAKTAVRSLQPLLDLSSWHESSNAPITLTRFLQDVDRPPSRFEGHHPGPQPVSTENDTFPMRLLPRKQDPRHRPWLRNGQERLELVADGRSSGSQGVRPAEGVLQDLPAFGTSYSVNMNVSPLSLGTYFHETSFLGSGALAMVLGTKPEGRLRGTEFCFTIAATTYRWGAWDELVAADMDQLLSMVATTARDEVADCEKVLWKISDYLTQHVTFLDPIDQLTCTSRLLSTVTQTFRRLAQEVTSTANNAPVRRDQQNLRLLSLVVCLVRRMAGFAATPRPNSEVSRAAQALLTEAARELISWLISQGPQLSTAGLPGGRQRRAPSAGLCRDSPVEAGWVIVYHCLRSRAAGQPGFWDLCNAILDTGQLLTASTATRFERHWQWQMEVLPLLEIGIDGIHVVGSRFSADARLQMSNWGPIVDMIKRLSFFTHPDRCSSQDPSFNGYCRTMLVRCLHLVEAWGWIGSESLLGAMFDIFAARNLSCLQLETALGSPSFLSSLDRVVDVHPEPGDSSFQLLLKNVVLALHSLKPRLTSKKISNLVLRLIPNHGRHYSKESEVQSRDLDSLQNHLDLLTVLHWAAPSGSRPSLGIVSRLVDPDASHHEAVRMSITAWTNLSRFQVSAAEPLELLQHLSDWHARLFKTAMRQHRAARAELEADASRRRSRGLSMPSASYLERIVTENQNRVDAILVELLGALQTILEAAPSIIEVRCLLQPEPLAQLLAMFVTGQSSNGEVLKQLLLLLRQLYLSCARAKEQSLSAAKTPEAVDGATNSEESQDSWACLLEDPAETSKLPLAENETAKILHDGLHRPLYQLLSRWMTSPAHTDSRLIDCLAPVVETWAHASHLSVANGFESWTSHLGTLGAFSWLNLPSSASERTASPLFLTRCIDAGAWSDAEPGLRVVILRAWVRSLVERESRFKYQHLLISSVLKAMQDDGSPLVANLPFTTDEASGRYTVSLADLKLRRGLVLEQVLENAQKALQRRAAMTMTQATDLHNETTEMVEVLLKEVKQNMEQMGLAPPSLDMGTAATEVGGRMDHAGAYRRFAATVIRAVRRHVPDLVKLDRWFDGLMDSSPSVGGRRDEML